MASSLPASPLAQVRLSDLLDWSVPVQWHEAVAVVRQIAIGAIRPHVPTDSSGSHLAERTTTTESDGAHLEWPPSAEDLAAVDYVDIAHGVPDPTGIWLLTSGAIRLDPVSMSEAIVPRLASLLGALLPHSAPNDLHHLVSKSAAAGETSPQEFLAALSFFARPDDSSEIRALMSRVLEARLADERAHALQSLTERARHADAPPARTGNATRKPMAWRRLVLIGTGLLLVAGFSMAAWALLQRTAAATPGSDAAAATPQSAARHVQQRLASAAAYVTETLTGTPPQSPGRGADVQLPARRHARGDRRGGVVPPELPVANAAGGGDVRTPDAVGPDVVLPSRVLPSADGLQQALAAAPHGVYSAANPDVMPPALVRPQMPEVPLAGLPVERPGRLELVVDEGGQVTSAKLVPVSNRHQDRMMVSAAKTWRFQPAMRFGRPVRYRLQMPITW